jgi:hypothetical protein
MNILLIKIYLGILKGNLILIAILYKEHYYAKN